MFYSTAATRRILQIVLMLYILFFQHANGSFEEDFTYLFEDIEDDLSASHDASFGYLIQLSSWDSIAIY